MNRRWNSESVKKELSKVHSNLEFTKVEYINPKTKITVSCPIHGDKQMYLYNLLKGHGCQNCSSTGPKKTKKVWLKEFNKIHKNKYSYERIKNKIITGSKIDIICKKHGIFKQLPSHHKDGVGCPKCANEKTFNFSNSIWKDNSIQSKSFHSFKLYIIKCWNENEESYKIGRTFQSINSRFRNNFFMPYNYEVVSIEVSDSSDYIFSKEKELQKLNKKHKYIPKNKFGGYTECFKEIQGINE